MTVNEIKESLENLSDIELNSLMNTIHEQSNKRKSERIKVAFEAFEKAAIYLDTMLDINDYDLDSEFYTMDEIIHKIKYSIQQDGGYDI